MIIRAQPSPFSGSPSQHWPCVVVLGLLAPQNHFVNLFPNLLCMQGNWPLQFIFPWFLKSLAST